MPGNAIKDVAPDPVLTRLAVELGTGGPFLADIIAPIMQVERDEFKFKTWKQEELKEHQFHTAKGPGAPAEEIEFDQLFSTGQVIDHKLKTRIPHSIIANDPLGTIEAVRTRKMMNLLRLGIEKRIEALVEAATKTIAAPSKKLDDTTVADRPDILKLIDDGKKAFNLNCGFMPNILVVPPIVAPHFFSNAGITVLARGTTAMSEQLIARGWIDNVRGLRVYVPGAITDTADPGDAISVAEVWDKDEMYYLFVDARAGTDPSAATALRQVRSSARTQTGMYVRRWDDPDQSAEARYISAHINQTELTISDVMILTQLDLLT